MSADVWWTCSLCCEEVGAATDGWHFCSDERITAPVRFSNLRRTGASGDDDSDGSARP